MLFAFFAVFTFLSLVCNTTVLIGTIFYNTIPVDKISVFFIKVLAAIDLTVTIVFISGVASGAKVWKEFDWDTFNIENPEIRYVLDTFWCLLVMEGTLIAFMIFHKFYSLLRPFKSLAVRKTHVAIACGIIAGANLLGSTLKYACLERLPKEHLLNKIITVVYLAIGLIVPLVIINVSIFGILHILNGRTRKDNDCKLNCMDHSILIRVMYRIMGAFWHRENSIRKCKFRKGIGIMCWIAIAFQLTIVPLQIIIMLSNIPKKSTKIMESDNTVYFVLTYMASCATNPLIYTILCRSFRQFLFSFMTLRKSPSISSYTTSSNVGSMK